MKMPWKRISLACLMTLSLSTPLLAQESVKTKPRIELSRDQALAKYIKQSEVDKLNLKSCDLALADCMADDNFWHSTLGEVIKGVLIFGVGYGTAKVVYTGSIL